VGEVLKLAGVKAPIGVQLTGEHSVYTARYRDGDARFVGVVRDVSEGGAEATLTLPEPLHVYDARAGRSLGRTDNLTLQMAPGECRMLALLPYEVETVNVRPREATVQQGRAVEYLVGVDVSANAEPGLHVYRVEVTDPSGDACAWYGTQLTAAHGVVSGRFTLALDDEPGEWTIRATDVATRVTGEATVTVTR